MKRLLAILLACWQMALAGETSLAWRDLAPAIAGKGVSVKLTDGKSLKGKASVDPDSLVLETRRGRQSIPRAEVREIHVARRTGYKWRIIGAAIGSGIGVAISVPVLAETHNEGSGRYDAAAAGLFGGLAALGYWAGGRGGTVDVIRILRD